jgi:mono/diheme cytochrome c family protein
VKSLSTSTAVAAFVLTIGIFLGAGKAAAETRKTDYAALISAPEKAQAKKNPLANDPKAVAAGGKLYEQHCADCHGPKGGGTRRGASLLRDEVQESRPGALFWLLTNGVVRRGMPVWSKLPEPERWQLVTFLKSLKLQPVNPPPTE